MWDPILSDILNPACPLKNKPSKQECKDPYFVLNPVMSPESISPVPPTVMEGVVLSITKAFSPSETIF